jgi:hypothetical protein
MLMPPNMRVHLAGRIGSPWLVDGFHVLLLAVGWVIISGCGDGPHASPDAAVFAGGVSKTGGRAESGGAGAGGATLGVGGRGLSFGGAMDAAAGVGGSNRLGFGGAIGGAIGMGGGTNLGSDAVGAAGAIADGQTDARDDAVDSIVWDVPTGGSGGGGDVGGAWSGGQSGKGEIDSSIDLNSSGLDPSTNTVTFSNGRALGAMTGYGWASVGPVDTISSPTCDGKPIEPLYYYWAGTAGTSCPLSAIIWNSVDALCMSGAVPAIPPNPYQIDYDTNWGLMLGVDAQDPSGPIGKGYASITVNVTGSPLSGLRIVVHVQGERDIDSYCAPFESGIPVPFSAFNTQCWDSLATVFLAETDVPKIDKIAVLVPSEQSEVRVDALCLRSIVFGGGESPSADGGLSHKGARESEGAAAGSGRPSAHERNQY